MNYFYNDVITLSPETTISEAGSLVEYLQGIGRAELDLTSEKLEIQISINSEDYSDQPFDLWTVREVLAEIEQALASHGVEFTVDRAKLREAE